MSSFGGRGTNTHVLLSMRALYSSHIAYFQLESRRAWKGDLGIGEEVVTCKLYLGLAFTIPTLERVTIGCCEVGGGGGGGVVGGVYVVCGDGVDRGVGGVDCGVVKAPISAMIIRVPEKDRWCGTSGKFVRWKGVRITKASKRAKVIVRGDVQRHDTSVECFVYYKSQGHVMTGFELHYHRGDQDVDAKGNDY
ncbi:hypothetical protein Tco_1063443 [Tanacetum coccineum]